MQSLNNAQIQAEILKDREFQQNHAGKIRKSSLIHSFNFPLQVEICQLEKTLLKSVSRKSNPENIRQQIKQKIAFLKRSESMKKCEGSSEIENKYYKTSSRHHSIHLRRDLGI